MSEENLSKSERDLIISTVISGLACICGYIWVGAFLIKWLVPLNVWWGFPMFFTGMIFGAVALIGVFFYVKGKLFEIL